MCRAESPLACQLTAGQGVAASQPPSLHARFRNTTCRASRCGVTSSRQSHRAPAPCNAPLRRRPHRRASPRHRPLMIPSFMFATGIENSYPDDRSADARASTRWRSAGTTSSGARTSICVAGAGHPLPALRPAAPSHAGSAPAATTGRSPTQTFDDLHAARHRAHRRPLPLRRARLDRQLPEPRLSRSCSPSMRGAFAQRYPWVQLYTPVNEMFICAHLLGARTAGGTSSSRSDRAFVTALKHIVKANVLAMHAILEVRPDAIFIQSESSEYFHADNPAAIEPAEIAERAALPVARPQLRPARRLGDVRVPDGQRHDARGVPLLPRATRSSTTASWATTTTSPTSTASSPTGRRGPRARCSATTRSPGSTTTATACRSCTPRPTSTQGPSGDEAVVLAVEGVGQRAARAQRRHPDRRLHLVFADRPGGLGHGAARDRTATSTRSASTTSTARSARSGEAYKQLIADWREVLPTQSVCLQRAGRAARRVRRGVGRRRSRRRRERPRRRADRARRTQTRAGDEPDEVRRTASRSSPARASGIGLATAKRLGSRGRARRRSPTSTPTKAEAAAATVKRAGAPDALGAAACDVSRRRRRWRPRVAGALQRFGRLDVVVNNAGLMIFKPIEEHTERRLARRCSRVDLLGAFFFIKQAFLHMKPGGAIVNVSSIHAVETDAAGRALRRGEGGAAVADALRGDRGQAARASASTPSCPAPSTRRCCGTTRT